MAANTPENKVKAAVKKVLADYPHYGYWPVPSGFGESTLDYIGMIRGRGFLIETKAPGKKPTRRQSMIMERARRLGKARVFVIDSVDSPELDILRTFLEFWSHRPFVSETSEP